MQLKKAAELRKREQEIVFEKKVKQEIDKDADKYKDKDAFVTPSYRKILEERKAEEERLRREEMAGVCVCQCMYPILNMYYIKFRVEVFAPFL